MQKNKQFIDSGIMCCDRTIDPIYNLCMDADIHTVEEFITNYEEKNLRGKSPITNAQLQGIAELYYFEKYSIPSDTMNNILNKEIIFNQNKHLYYAKIFRRLGFNNNQVKIIECQLKKEESNNNSEEKKRLNIIGLLTNLEKKIERKNLVAQNIKVKIAILQEMYYSYNRLIQIEETKHKLEKLLTRISEINSNSEAIQHKLNKLTKN